MAPRGSATKAESQRPGGPDALPQMDAASLRHRCQYHAARPSEITHARSYNHTSDERQPDVPSAKQRIHAGSRLPPMPLSLP